MGQATDPCLVVSALARRLGWASQDHGDLSSMDIGEDEIAGLVMQVEKDEFGSFCALMLTIDLDQPEVPADPEAFANLVAARLRDIAELLTGASKARAFAPPEAATQMIPGRVTGKPREGNMAPGVSEAICHACGLGYRCGDADCPNPQESPANLFLASAQDPR
jgi:hypothetical protein